MTATDRAREERDEIEVSFVRALRSLALEVAGPVYDDFAEKARAYMGNLAAAYRERDALASALEDAKRKDNLIGGLLSDAKTMIERAKALSGSSETPPDERNT